MYTHTQTPLMFTCEIRKGRLMILHKMYDKECLWSKGKGTFLVLDTTGDFSFNIYFLKNKTESIHDKILPFFSDH